MAFVPLPAGGLAGSPRTGQYYKHSGGLNPAGVALAAVVGTVAAAAMAVPYAYADNHIPEIYLNGLVCIVFGVALGVVPAAVLKQFKVRNLPVSLAVICLVAAVGVYASWVAWEAILLRGGLAANVGRLAAHPDAVVAFGRRVNEIGTWGIGSSSVSSSSSSSSQTNNNTTGVFLALIWLAEAATLIGGALVVGRAMLHSLPFCDACDRWCEKPKVVHTTALADPAAVRQRLEAGDFAYVATLGPATPEAGLTFRHHACGGCGRLNTLSVSTRQVVRDKRGRVRQNKSKMFVDKLLVTPADLARLTPAAAVPK